MTAHTVQNRDRKVLVAVSSKHGSTEEIAQCVGEMLTREGLDATVGAVDEVGDLSAFDAVVLGSAVYAGRWRKDARELAERIGLLDRPPLVWLFSSGPLGDPPLPADEPTDAPSLIEKTGAIEHRVFAGSLDKSNLSFGEKAIVSAVNAPDGDFRDWQEIESWAKSVADRVLLTGQPVDV